MSKGTVAAKSGTDATRVFWTETEKMQLTRRGAEIVRERGYPDSLSATSVLKDAMAVLPADRRRKIDYAPTHAPWYTAALAAEVAKLRARDVEQDRGEADVQAEEFDEDMGGFPDRERTSIRNGAEAEPWDGPPTAEGISFPKELLNFDPADLMSAAEWIIGQRFGMLRGVWEDLQSASRRLFTAGTPLPPGLAGEVYQAGARRRIGLDRPVMEESKA